MVYVAGDYFNYVNAFAWIGLTVLCCCVLLYVQPKMKRVLMKHAQIPTG